MVNEFENALIIVSDDEAWEEGPNVVAHWSSFQPKEGQISIPHLVEQQSSLLRQEYLHWVFDLSNAKIGGKTFFKRGALSFGKMRGCSQGLSARNAWK